MHIKKLERNETIRLGRSILDVQIDEMGDRAVVISESAVTIKITNRVGAQATFLLGQNSHIIIAATAQLARGLTINIPGGLARVSCKAKLPINASITPAPS